MATRKTSFKLIGTAYKKFKNLFENLIYFLQSIKMSFLQNS